MGPPGHLNPLERVSTDFLVLVSGLFADGFFFLWAGLAASQSSLPDSLGQTQVPISSE